tara:strand:+ start:1630 stop:2253 length:624 start_codon:yes stop_codon:yes gene_type:complete
MTEFWEDNFKDKQMMWGEAPAKSTLIVRDYFVENDVKNVLIPGVGYGRNAVPFIEAGMSVTGIEISQTAIDIAKDKLQLNIPIHHGPVSAMPFDENKYDGIFCYAVIHLLDEAERKKLILDCYNQLASGGQMIFVAISTDAPSYGKGTEIGPHRFEQHGGVQIYFYNKDSMEDAFKEYGLIKIQEVAEVGGKDGISETPFLMAMCKK